MKLKTLCLYEDFISLLRHKVPKVREYARLGDLLLTFKLLNTSHLSAEGKLTYAYLFFHRDETRGFRIRVLSDALGMPPAIIRSALHELEKREHIARITTERSPDLSELVYHYKIVDPRRYGMLAVEDNIF